MGLLHRIVLSRFIRALSAVFAVLGLIVPIAIAVLLLGPEPICGPVAGDGAENTAQCVREWANVVIATCATVAAFVAGFLAWRSVQMQINEDKRRHALDVLRNDLRNINAMMATMMQYQNAALEANLAITVTWLRSATVEEAALALHDSIIECVKQTKKITPTMHLDFSPDTDAALKDIFKTSANTVFRFGDECGEIAHDFRSAISAARRDQTLMSFEALVEPRREAYVKIIKNLDKKLGAVYRDTAIVRDALIDKITISSNPDDRHV